MIFLKNSRMLKSNRNRSASLAFDYKVSWLGESLHSWHVKSVFPRNLGRVVHNFSLYILEISFGEKQLKSDSNSYARECWEGKAFSSSRLKTHNKKRRISWSLRRYMREFQSWAAGVLFLWEERLSTSKFIVTRSKLLMIYLWTFIFD